MSNTPLYTIREPREILEGLDVMYAPYDGPFSFEIHHGGYFTPKPGISYVDGKLDHADCVDIDLFSVHEMDSIMEDLGYTGQQVMLYFFLKPGFCLDDGLHPLSSDQDVIKLSEYIGKHRLIPVYVEHGKSKNISYFREYLMIKIGNVQRNIDKCTTVLTPNATKLLDVVKKEASSCKAVFNGLDKYQVNGPWGDQCVVDITNMTCSCRKWEITGIPCKHAVATNWNMGQNKIPVGCIESWVDPIYRLDTWKLMYHFKITPTNGINMWTKSDVPTMIIPPHYHTPVGRPKKKRRKTAEEIQMVKKGKLSRRLRHVVCNKCGGVGHNKRTCTADSQHGGEHDAVGHEDVGGPSGASGPEDVGAPSARQTAPSSPTGASHHVPTQSSQTASTAPAVPNATQTAPSSPSFRTANTLVRSPGGTKWVKFRSNVV